MIPFVTRILRGGKSEAGAELIEFALIFPILLMTTLAIVDFGFLFHRQEVVTNAAREGARIAALPGYNTSDVQNRVVSFITTAGVPTTGGNPVVTVTPSTVPDGAGTWPASTVNVVYDHDYMFIGSIVGWFGGASFSNVDLEAVSIMRHVLSGP